MKITMVAGIQDQVALIGILTPRSLDALTVVMEATAHGDIDVMALLIVIMEVMRSTVKISNSKPRKYHV